MTTSHRPKPVILLSFDIEEFDMPLEYGKSLSFNEQLTVSSQGAVLICDLLAAFKIQVTFFCTANFAIHRPELIRRMVAEGHEIASHAYFHSTFTDDDLASSKQTLEKISRSAIHGFRMPRMMPVNLTSLQKAGYIYNSSLNPTFIPGRYNHLNQPRTFFFREGIFQIPSSVTPRVRFPLFWLSFHHIAMPVLLFLCRQTIEKDRYLNLYFHPWEFIDLRTKETFGLPAYVSRMTGVGMIHRLTELIAWAQRNGYEFERMSDFTLRAQGSDGLRPGSASAGLK